MAQPKAAPHPATVVQPKRAFGLPVALARAPHPATVLQTKLRPGMVAQRAQLPNDEKKTVLVRPWFVDMEYADGRKVSSAAINYDDIFLMAQNVWAKADIGLKFLEPEKLSITMAKALVDYKPRDGFFDEVKMSFQSTICKQLEKDKGKTDSLQLIYIPTFDRWGFAFREGNDVYGGPVAYVATHDCNVGDENQIRESLPNKAFSPYGIALDTAHEIGHLFGLEHVNRNEDVKRLMHKALYHTVCTEKAMNADEGKFMQIAKAKALKDEPQLFNRQGVVLVMHGEELTKDELDIVRKNATFLRLAK